MKLKRIQPVAYMILVEFLLYLNILFLWLRFSAHASYEWVFILFFFCVLTLIHFFLPTNLAKVLLCIALFVLYLYGIAQEIYNSAFQSYFLIKTAFSAGDEVAGVASSVFELIKAKHIIVMLIWLLNPIILSLLRPAKRKKLRHKTMPLRCIAVALSSFCAVFLILMLQRDIEAKAESADALDTYTTDLYFYRYMPNTNGIVSRFGMFGLLYRDTFAKLYYTGAQFALDDATIIEVLDEVAQLYPEHENEYTGILAGKHLMVIQAESLMNGAISEELTPNLYKMQQEGIIFPNWNAPLMNGSTSDTEFQTNTGLIALATGDITFTAANQNTFPTTLPKMFSAAGYSSQAYHSNFADYYDRDKMMPQLGFDFYPWTRLNVSFLAHDDEMMEKLKWIVYGDDPVYGYFITYTAHQPYSIAECELDDDTLIDKVREVYPGIDDSTACYVAKNIYVDRAVGAYMKQMQAYNQDAVIIVFGDHFAKSISSDIGAFGEYNGLKTPLMIWYNGVEHLEVDKFGTTVDLLPTIANLFGLEYDHRTVFGGDLLDDSYRGFFFDNWGDFITPDYDYNMNEGYVVLKSNMSEEEAKADANQHVMMLNVARTIVETDFFARHPEYGK
ncbi:MAG: sulfatase-like hydrolase/transferase [Erysipelotrichaceae bacterium]|jgi:phosphoglycerol transferase MdoB-like AlkP superfamily enzyme|nr:sulfatase-like hydrolase/transferase [Erysipelotrichaceae bacterium]